MSPCTFIPSFQPLHSTSPYPAPYPSSLTSPPISILPALSPPDLLTPPPQPPLLPAPPLHRLVHVSPHYVIRSRAYVSDLQTFLVYNNLFGSSLTSLYVTITIRIFGGFQAVTNANRLHIGLAFCATCLDFKSCACRNVICWCSHQHYFA